MKIYGTEADWQTFTAEVYIVSGKILDAKCLQLSTEVLHLFMFISHLNFA